MKHSRKKIWEYSWFSWVWKIIAGLAVASTVACTWWMKLNFATKEEIQCEIKVRQGLVSKEDFEKHKERCLEELPGTG